jgi:hypothetical protein
MRAGVHMARLASRLGSRVSGRAPAVFRLLPGAPAASLCASGALGGSYGETLTFTRASGKHAESGSGVQTLLSNNQPGVEPKGLLMEAAGTNLCIRSGALDNAAWSLFGNGSAAPTRTANASAAPDGNVVATRLDYPAVANTAGHESVIFSTAFAGTSASYTASIWLKKVSGSGSTVYAFFQNQGTGALTGTPTACAVTTEWQRFTVTATLAAATNYFLIIGFSPVKLSSGATTAVVVDAWGAQAELGTFASSYIATLGTSATRVAETASVSSAAFPITAGSVELDYTPSWGGTPAANRVLFDTRKAAATDDGLIAYIDTSRLLNLITDGATTFTLSSAALTWTAGQRYRMRFVWGGGNLYMYRDDVLVASDTSAVRPMPTQHSGTCWLGSDYTGGATAYGHISNFSVRR